jgi:hypothetical protein
MLPNEPEQFSTEESGLTIAEAQKSRTSICI